MKRSWTVVTLVMALAGLVMTPISAVPSASADRLISTSCAPSQVVVASSLGPAEIHGTATSGQFWALGSEIVPVQIYEKILFRMTGAGQLHLDALGPNGEVISPTEMEEHAPGGSTWKAAGDEWGSLWDFPDPGCWEIRASRDGVQGNLWLDVTGPPLRITRFLVKQSGHRETTVRTSAPIVLVLHVSNPYSRIPQAHVVLEHAGKQYAAFTISRPSEYAYVTDIFRYRMRLHVTAPTKFKAIATLQLEPATDQRSVRFTVRP